MIKTTYIFLKINEVVNQVAPLGLTGHTQEEDNGADLAEHATQHSPRQRG